MYALMNANARTGKRSSGCAGSKVMSTHGRDELNNNGERLLPQAADNRLVLLNAFCATPSRGVSYTFQISKLWAGSAIKNCAFSCFILLSSGLSYRTARSYREPTITAKRIGWPAHIGAPRHKAVYGTYLRVHLGWSTVTTARSYRGPSANQTLRTRALEWYTVSNGPLISGTHHDC